MTHAQLLALGPFLIVSAATVVVMLAIAVKRHHGFVAAVSMASLALALGSTAAVWHASAAPQTVGVLLIIDRFACFYLAMIFLRVSAGWRGRRMAWLAVSVLICSLVTWATHFGLRSVLPG